MKEIEATEMTRNCHNSLETLVHIPRPPTYEDGNTTRSMTDGLQIDDFVGLRKGFFQATVKRFTQRRLIPFDPAEPGLKTFDPRTPTGTYRTYIAGRACFPIASEWSESRCCACVYGVREMTPHAMDCARHLPRLMHLHHI